MKWPLVALLIGLCSLPVQALDVKGISFNRRVQAISRGQDSGERRRIVLKQLTDLGIRYECRPFSADHLSGVNILTEEITSASGERPLLLLGAHYDKTLPGKGAVDNASGVGAVLELFTEFRAVKSSGYRIQAVFFDLEEKGLLGSRSFLESCSEEERPNLYWNFDVFGYGNTLCLMSADPHSPSVRALQKASIRRIPLYLTSSFPPGDDRSFVSAKIETLGLALLKRSEIEEVLPILPAAKRKKAHLLSVLHSTEDTPDKISAKDAGRALSVLLKALQILIVDHPSAEFEEEPKEKRRR